MRVRDAHSHSVRAHLCSVFICGWWISWRNAEALDHFNHFLLYLWQLLGEVEITVWLCFDAFPPLTRPKKGGNPHVPSSLPSPELSSTVWCGTFTEIKSLINILLFTLEDLHTGGFIGERRLHGVDKNAAIMLRCTNTSHVISWHTFGF